jgi:hypothetical protein
MRNIRRIAVVMLVVAGFSLSVAGCKSSGKTRRSEHPTAEHRQGEHPKREHPKGEHPQRGEHPQGEHPK